MPREYVTAFLMRLVIVLLNIEELPITTQLRGMPNENVISLSTPDSLMSLAIELMRLKKFSSCLGISVVASLKRVMVDIGRFVQTVEH